MFTNTGDKKKPREKNPELQTLKQTKNTDGEQPKQKTMDWKKERDTHNYMYVHTLRG